MIIVHGLIPILPERRSEALKLIRWMERETQAEEGCLTYRFFVGLNDPNTLMLFQEWDSAEALEAHFETAHMAPPGSCPIPSVHSPPRNGPD